MTVIAPIITPTMKPRIRIAAYCRVSTDACDQKHSLQVQKAHFMSLYGHSADYELVDIYADMGISATKANIRPEFQRMLDDCHRGRIDRVVCKSISRFARNTKDCLTALCWQNGYSIMLLLMKTASLFILSAGCILQKGWCKNEFSEIPVWLSS